jgi:glycine cleavage system H protein
MKYTVSHEWVKVEQDDATVGITQYAQQELGEVVYVQLPFVGQELVQGQEAAVLESTKAATDIYSPLSGVVVERNIELEKNPGLINSSPEDLGWLFKVKNFSKHSVEELLDREEYQKLLK